VPWQENNISATNEEASKQIPVITQTHEWIQASETGKVDVVTDNNKVSDVVRWVHRAASICCYQHFNAKTCRYAHRECQLQ